jgi:hypothetical protein
MDENKQLIYVSHIIRDELPSQGLSKLYFYTMKGDKYYWGSDNNSFNEEYMRNIENKKQVIKLPRLIEIEKDGRKALWADSEGKVYIADKIHPFSEESLNPLEGIILK